MRLLVLNFNSPELHNNTGMQETHKTSSSTSNVLLSSFLLRSSHGDEVGGSNKRCPLKSNFDAERIHESKQSALLIAIF